MIEIVDVDCPIPQLPSEWTPFIGRITERDELARLLMDPKVLAYHTRYQSIPHYYRLFYGSPGAHLFVIYI